MARKTSTVRDPLVVVLVDMQEFFTCEVETGARDALIRAQTEMIRQCAKRDIPLIVLEYRNHGPTIVKLAVEIKRVPRVTVIDKPRNNGFFNTRLHNVLQELGAESLLFMGINASVCVFFTALAASDRGYRVLTADDLIANAHYVEKGDICRTRRWYEQANAFLPHPLSLFTA